MPVNDLGCWLPSPATRQNVVETFNLICKGTQDKDLERKPAMKEPPGPHVLAVAQSLQDMLDAGVVNSRAELARRMGVSRARVTQLLNLLKLPVQVRDEILALPEEQQRRFSERGLRAIARMPSPAKQVQTFERLRDKLDV